MMKNLTFIAMMAMALSLGACSTDDDEEAKVLSFTLTTEEVLSDSLTIGWDAIPGAAIYDLHLTNQDGSDIRDESSILKTFDFSKLFAGTEYTFTIKAYDASDNLLCELTNKKYTTKTLPTGLVGKWQNGTVTSIKEIYLFNANGTGEYTLGTTTVALRWKTLDNKIILNINYPSGAVRESYSYEISPSMGIKIGQNSYVNVN